MCRLFFYSLKYSKSRQTGSAVDSKLCYTIQFSILMLCAKYQEAGLCSSREKCDSNYLVSRICLCPQYSKSRKTGSGHAADSKLRTTIQFSILMLCAKYREAGLSGSKEKCDRNYLVSKFAYVHNIESRVKQEVDMPQIQNCVPQYSSPY